MKTKILGVVAALAFSIASPAMADIVYVTYTGTVSAGTDFTGVFGPSSTLLDGASYTLTYTFDTSRGIFTSDASASQLAGGPGFGPAIFNPYSSPGSAVLTINGHSVSFNANPNPPSQGYSEYYVVNNGSYIRSDQHVSDSLDYSNIHIDDIVDISINDYTLTIPTLLTTPYTLSIEPGVVVMSSGFRIVDGSYDATNNFRPDQFASGDLSPTSVTVSETPLPSALPLFASGLGALGLLGWRKKRKNAAAIAA
jgi:hypothetical protein